jgi:hypothetical protein
MCGIEDLLLSQVTHNADRHIQNIRELKDLPRVIISVHGVSDIKRFFALRSDVRTK